jgi:uncharacterized protein (TIGR03086 family)
MTDERASAALIEGIGLLERAINYTLGSLRLVTPEALPRPTPCRDWDLRALLGHLDDSLTALYEAVDIGYVDVGGAVGPAAADPVALVRDRARQLIGAWTNVARRDCVSIGGNRLTAGVVTGTGAIEIAVHGWDVARACGQSRPIPRGLAEELLDLSPFFVTGDDRPDRFAAPIDVPPLAGPGDRLVAFLGRRP